MEGILFYLHPLTWTKWAELSPKVIRPKKAKMVQGGTEATGIGTSIAASTMTSTTNTTAANMATSTAVKQVTSIAPGNVTSTVFSPPTCTATKPAIRITPKLATCQG